MSVDMRERIVERVKTDKAYAAAVPETIAELRRYGEFEEADELEDMLHEAEA